MSRSQCLLLIHFCGVASFGLGRLLLPIPTPHGIITSIHVIRQACSIIMPLIARENYHNRIVCGICRFMRIITWV